ncbi:MAG: UDP-N-acetylmuramate--L-alanine ligase [Deltaproteobacteria bacterium]|nr:UDP-N-acetylmuramate--L-alanine ligase [Deltaproteobacteria bacterium]
MEKQHIHLLGIGGTGMGALATLLVEDGHTVTGTDEALYPPMSDQLASLGITVNVGYTPQNLTKRPDLVIIGNVITKENPEAQATLEQKIPYQSMPQAVATFFLKDRTPLVITGTHGKTTTATLTAWLLTATGKEPGYFIGGVGKNFGKNAARGKPPFFVVEGDEYDTAFFDKGPKFMHYQARGAIMTSIEFDHADIYRDITHITEAFRRFMESLSKNDVLVANADDPIIAKMIPQATCRVVTYGMKSKATYAARNVKVTPEGTSFEFQTPHGTTTVTTPLFGDHNVMNTMAAMALLMEHGLSLAALKEALPKFEGVKRRMDIIGEGQGKGIVIIDDFAHHPTAVKTTIAALRGRYPGRRLWAIFEPRSNTSRRRHFQREYVDALMSADRVVIAGVFKSEKIDPNERLNPQAIADDLMNNGVDAHTIAGTEFILEYIVRNIDSKDVVLFMSNGGFDGIHHKLLDKIDRRKLYTDHSALKMGRIPKLQG